MQLLNFSAEIQRNIEAIFIFRFIFWQKRFIWNVTIRTWLKWMFSISEWILNLLNCPHLDLSPCWLDQIKALSFYLSEDLAFSIFGESKTHPYPIPVFSWCWHLECRTTFSMSSCLKAINMFCFAVKIDLHLCCLIAIHI